MRSFVARNLYINGELSSAEIFREFPKYYITKKSVLAIAETFGWFGCYGLNKILHRHTDYPVDAVFKNIQNLSYSDSEYILDTKCFATNTEPSGFCPICVKEDIERIGFAFWRARCSSIKVCAEHNTILVKRCPSCDKEFSRGGHDLSVMWEGCSNVGIKNCDATPNTDSLEFKKAQIYRDLLSSEHHISEEAALATLHGKLSLDKRSQHALWDPNDSSTLEAKIEWRLKLLIDLRSRNRPPPKESTKFIVQGITELYSTFSDFVVDAAAYGHEFRPIESLWSTYLSEIREESSYFIEEDYDQGVGVWSCPFPATQDWRTGERRPISYPCCNFEQPRQKVYQLKPSRATLPPPGIYRRS